MASRSQRRSCPSPRKARRRPAPTPVASRKALEEHRTGIGIELRRLVLRQPALHDRARENADEPAALLDHGHALEVTLLQLVESVLERHRMVERKKRRLGELRALHLRLLV